MESGYHVLPGNVKESIINLGIQVSECDSKRQYDEKRIWIEGKGGGKMLTGRCSIEVLVYRMFSGRYLRPSLHCEDRRAETNTTSRGSFYPKGQSNHWQVVFESVKG